MERTLPAKIAPPRSTEGTAVVLIIDKSSSMEGRKIELARLAAIGVVENLRPIDSVGVLIFDNSFQWAVPIRKADDRASIKRLISGITPDGGTQIAPALTAVSYTHLDVYKRQVLVWAVWEWRTSSRRGALLLKAGALASVAAALAMPRLTVYETKMAVALLADTSASISPRDLAAESALADRMEGARGRHWMRVIPFARTTRNTAIDERLKGNWHLRHTAAPAGHGTDLEAAIRDGAASLPAGMVPRLVLASDGHENSGSVASAIWQAQQLGIPIDTVPLPGRPKPGLLLDSVSIPGQVFSGERFAVEVTVEAPRNVRADVELSAEGKSLGRNTAELSSGVNHLRLQASVNAVGAIDLAGKVSAEGLGETQFEDAVTLRSPRVLLVSNDPESSETHLLHTLQANQFETERNPNGIPEKLDPYQLVIINNWDMESIPAARKAALEDLSLIHIYRS